jgi:hypothetical protein
MIGLAPSGMAFDGFAPQAFASVIVQLKVSHG